MTLPGLTVLTKRSDFVALSRAKRAATPGFVLQARHVGHDTKRVGFTCSKKVGNAVARNRAKRRLREIARLALPEGGKTGWDYVLVGRRTETAARPFSELQEDFRRALAKVHGP